MRNAILVGIFALLSLIFSATANAQQIWVSPEKGEGPVQIAERYNVSPAAFIRLNKDLGRFIDPKRINLVHTWQKFALPEGGIHEISKAKTYLKPPNEPIMEKIAPEKNINEKSINAEFDKKIIKSENWFQGTVRESCERAILTLQSTLNYQKKLSNFVNHQAPIIVSILVFLFCICVLLIGFLTYDKQLAKKFGRKNNTQRPLFSVCFSDIFSGYCILPNNGKNIGFEFKHTLDEIAATAAKLYFRYGARKLEELFEYGNTKDKIPKTWRKLGKDESIEFENIAKSIIKQQQNEELSWKPKE